MKFLRRLHYWRVRRHIERGDLLAAQKLMLRRLKREFG